MSEVSSYSWSKDFCGEYHGEFSTREEAARQALDYETDPETVWTGRLEDVPIDEFVEGHASSVIDQMACWADEACGDGADDYPHNTKEQERELDAAIADTIRAWMVKHDLQPQFRRVVDIEKWEPSAAPGTPLAAKGRQT